MTRLLESFAALEDRIMGKLGPWLLIGAALLLAAGLFGCAKQRIPYEGYTRRQVEVRDGTTTERILIWCEGEWWEVFRRDTRQ